MFDWFIIGVGVTFQCCLHWSKATYVLLTRQIAEIHLTDTALCVRGSPQVLGGDWLGRIGWIRSGYLGNVNFSNVKFGNMTWILQNVSLTMWNSTVRMYICKPVDDMSFYLSTLWISEKKRLYLDHSRVHVFRNFQLATSLQWKILILCLIHHVNDNFCMQLVMVKLQDNKVRSCDVTPWMFLRM
jgi:hypothetical protein